MMAWDRLLSNRRIGQDKPRRNHPEARSDFQRDFDRVIFSPEFRRLQSKTQVVPLPDNDFVHTRLTHSLEASCVGRSLARIIGNRVIAGEPKLFQKLGVTASDFESIVASACLAHDIGNPPFGHSGEDAISGYFRSERAAKFIEQLTPKQVADLQNFEGNAAGFRLLTHTPPAQSSHPIGLGLTYATLGAFTKYPKESLPNRRKSGLASEKKFGFFQSEKEMFTEVAKDLGLLQKHSGDDLLWHRHPLAFLVEAADDICYTLIDLEDGYKMGRISFEVVEGLLIALIDGFERMRARYDKIHDPREKVGYLRATAINRLIWQTADLFTEKLPEILKGKFDAPLTSGISASKILDDISQLSFEKIYRSQAIIEIEAAGFEVLGGLLDAYLHAIFEPDSQYNKLLGQLIPDRYLAPDRKPFADKYECIINITELVAGMTDTRAIDAYRKLKGISLPNY